MMFLKKEIRPNILEDQQDIFNCMLQNHSKCEKPKGPEILLDMADEVKKIVI